MILLCLTAVLLSAGSRTASVLVAATELAATGTPLPTATTLLRRTPMSPLSSPTACRPALTTTTQARLRSGPGLTYRTLAVMPRDAQADLVAHSADGMWYQIVYDAEPSEIDSGKCAELAWSVTDAQTVILNDGVNEFVVEAAGRHNAASSSACDPTVRLN